MWKIEKQQIKYRNEPKVSYFVNFKLIVIDLMDFAWYLESHKRHSLIFSDPFGVSFRIQDEKFWTRTFWLLCGGGCQMNDLFVTHVMNHHAKLHQYNIFVSPFVFIPGTVYL